MKESLEAMASNTKITKRRRMLRKKKIGQKRKKILRKKGSTPKFSIHISK